MTITVALEFEQVEACPACGSASIAPYKVGVKLLNNLKYSQCGECETIFLNPRLSDEQTKTYYQGLYRNALGLMCNADLDTQKARAGRQVEVMRPYLKGCKTALEIGASAGYLLAELGRLRIGAVGIEPDTRYHMAEPARNYPMFADIADCPEDPFDLICMSHSLEHLNHPQEYVRHLIDHYSHPWTRFLIEVPNGGQSHRAFLVHHPIVFTEKTLEGLFARQGRKLMVAHYYGPKDMPRLNMLMLFMGTDGR